jgi:peptidoglycan hydrolase-like protein with peptidoglycan-binding domain
VIVCALGVALVVPFSHSNASSGALASDTTEVPTSGDTSPDDTSPDDTSPDDTSPAGTDSANTDSSVATSVQGTGATSTTQAARAATDDSGDIVGTETSCVLTARAIRRGNAGANVTCLQQALKANGYLQGAVTGKYTQATVNAVRKLQTEKDLFVDGIAGRETALALGIWPDEASAVVRTPKPKKGAKDLLGYELSSVASAGADAPPVPEDSGSGRRLVFSRLGQRVWAIDDDGRVVRSWLVSGSKFANETPGTHRVYSKSKITTAWNGKATLRLMVRWLKTKIGAIGFHQIPIRRSNKQVYQTEEELGSRLSGGCQRQAPLDAKFLWDFADIGTRVVVL